MALIVVMAGGEPHTPAFRRFCMHFKVWPRVLALAEAHGWEPAGTTLVWQDCGIFAPDYACADSGKQVADADAQSMAAALERAIPRLMAGEIEPFEAPSPALIVESWLISAGDMFQANRGITVPFLGEFVAFAHCGGFCFYWDD